MPELSARVRRIGLSPTLRISGLAAELRASGEDVLDFSAGQPDFPTHPAAVEAGVEAIREGRTRYTQNEGLPELRRAIVDRVRAEQGIEYAPDQVLVSPGAKASLFYACLTLLDEGDEVLVPTPYWVSYPEQVGVAGARSVFVPCAEEEGFKLSGEQLAARISARTRALILNYPSNPTGACYTRAELEPLAELCERHGIWILADEIYSHLLYDGRSFTSVAALGHGARERTVMIHGMSKTWSMTGWRIGWAAGPREVIRGMARLQSHATSNAASISQWASVAALTASEDETRRRVSEFQRRRDVIVAALRELPGVSCLVPQGSFYAFPNISGCLGRRTPGGVKIDSAERLAEYLLERAKVAVVPGEAFGSAAHLRLSYAVSMERLREGMRRIDEALAALA